MELDHEDEEEDATVMVVLERNHQFKGLVKPICLQDLSAKEDITVSYLTKGGKHFKPSHLEEDNPLVAL